LDFLRQLFGSGDFQPHGFCYLWNARLVWLHAVSDLLIALAYLTIPVTLVWLVVVGLWIESPFNIWK